MMRRIAWIGALAALLCLGSCGDDTETWPDDPDVSTTMPDVRLPDIVYQQDGEAADGPTDGSLGDLPGPSDAPGPEFDLAIMPDSTPDMGGQSLRPEGYASLVFRVDDRANQSYQDGQMEWNASLVYNEDDNSVRFSSSWLPTEGPFPRLYDDGPIYLGGHEEPGATAGDHIFSLEVYYLADEETTFEYGLINEFDNWIWEGPNGSLTVPQGSTAIHDAGTVKFHVFGHTDLKVTLDLNNLNENYLPFAFASVFLKGSMNSWYPVQILDNGSGDDDVADDGIYTFIHSNHLGPHDGLLYPGQHAQFVFVFSNDWAENGIEYKAGPDALPDGVRAYIDCVEPGTWTEAEVFLEVESRGVSKNTTVQACDPIIYEDAGVADMEYLDASVPPEDRPHRQDRIAYEDVGPLKEDMITPPDSSLPPEGGPEIILVDPGSGSTSGGTTIAITGRRFVEGTQLFFGGAQATNIVVADEKHLTCTTPPGTEGKVDVKAINPDGKWGIYRNGYTYIVIRDVRVTRVEPSHGTIRGGERVQIQGENFAAGAQARFGNDMGTDIWVNEDTGLELWVDTPAHAEGPVTVTVTNPDNQSGSLEGAFTYEPDLVDWGNLQWPYEINEAMVGMPTEPIYGQVYEWGITDMPGHGTGLQAEVGWGPEGTDPSAPSWQWASATYNTDVENNDEYIGQIVPTAPGRFNFCFRYSLNGEDFIYGDRNDEGHGEGSADGYQASNAGLMIVQAPPEGPVILSFDPPFAPVTGDTITVLGSGFDSGTTLTVEGQPAASFQRVSDTELTFALGAHAAGFVSVRATDSQARSFDKDLAITCYLTPVLDGQVGDDWDPACKMGQNDEPSDWAPEANPDMNTLRSLYVAFDDERLYIGIQGQVETGDPVWDSNALLVYLDTDPGGATGPSVMSQLSDIDGSLDYIISNTITVSVPGFGADLVAGSRGMQSTPDFAVENYTDSVGWRDLEEWANFYWLDNDIGRISANGATMGWEASIRLDSLFPGGVPASGARVALFARLTAKDALSNQTLPFDNPLNPGTVGQVAEIAVFRAP